ncbi:zinc-finger homeodomain protein 9 [Ziziphus jujuba]|uniref:Zinc-finger homeodomain protein 9 n=1 Tax=Ziziphus jujuba TaxID=326968 RepID=A0A6P4A6C1_ZIZJJ|nr:zinc-finger homeodomain protein 9 [Ziziphus jujuba]
MEGESTNEVYRECLRNHAASLGSYATDGCGEFTLDDTSSEGGLQCAACGCHRNFHRKVTYAGGNHPSSTTTTTTTTTAISQGRRRDHNQPSSMSGEMMMMSTVVAESPESDRSGKKRIRTKFTADQKEKMFAFAEKIGWKLQRKDLEDEIESFCKSVGVSRQVFKVWMHNHKNLSSSSSANSIGNASSLTQ